MGFCDMWRVLTRRKVLEDSSIESSQLSRVLTTGDLTALGVGSTLGVGVYVLAGHVAKESAGPSVVISFLLAAIASVFAGLCYAEFGAKLPRAGSAYIYSYVCVGELIAFVIGWNLILEYVIGSASVARGISLYLDSLLNNTLKNSFKDAMPIYGNFNIVSEYFDILAFGLAFLIGIALAFGMKESSIINNIFTVLNLAVVIFVIAAGAFAADIDNWYILGEELKPADNGGKGGFFPFGFSGTLKGAATCFFGFVGFDCIATTGEEVQNPKRAIPLSIISSLIIIFLSYFGVSAILTLMVPYYLQNSDAPIPFAFEHVGWIWAKWIVAIGGIFGLFASLFGAMFPLPRILYAMASDGLIFRFLGRVHPRFKTPIIGTLFASLITGTMAGLFELRHLVNMMSIGTLMAYTIVAACVLLLRYETDSKMSVTNENFNTILNHKKYSCGEVFRQLFNCSCRSSPTKLSAVIVGFLIVFYFIFCFAFGLCMIYSWTYLVDKTIWSIVITTLFGCCMLVTIILIGLQPKSKTELSFQVPLVPLLPAVSIFINIYLMLMLDANTWIRFAIWMAVGIPVYLISLCVYDRGANYIAHTQKSSINGHMKGNLNYAFENLNECQERAMDFDYSIKVVVDPPSDSELDNNLELTEQGEVVLITLRNGNVPSSTSGNTDGEVFNVETEKAVTSTENEDSRDDSVEIIEFLDKVIKDEEEACENSLEFSEPVEDIVPVYSDAVDNKLYIDDNVDETSVQNVVALVHREDETCKNEIPTDPDPVTDVETTDDTDVLKNEIDIDGGELTASKDPNGEIEPVAMAETEPTEVIFIPKPPPMDETIFIPKPPPMDETFFQNPKPLFKSKTVNLKKSKPESLIESVEKQEASVDDSEIKPGTDFLKKLNNFYGGYSINPRKNLTKTVSKDPIVQENAPTSEQQQQLKRTHSSEPDLMNALKLSIMNHKPLKKIGESHKLNGQGDVAKVAQNPEEPYDHSDKPKTKNDIKKMLEAVLASGPKAQAPRQSMVKSLKEDNGYESDPELVVDDDAIKPKTKENFTRTMKMQRAIFENVLKSIEFQTKRESIDGGKTEVNYNINIPRVKSMNRADLPQVSQNNR
ncbi:high affinity cationic amino acid transporter 1-like [Arctopsyche grandis]|uniref:high affinity cationic amino acid transporter 1-like n=1 Tax=Arctopsyche grandis TaxID=121162 RepID=UPI00406DA019